MPASCCAYGCTNRFKTGGNIQFFGFPFKDEEKVKQWVHALKRKGFSPTKASKLCSEHFLPTDFLDRPGSYIKKLKPDAVPSVFSAFPAYYQCKPKMPRLRTAFKECTMPTESDSQLCENVVSTERNAEKAVQTENNDTETVTELRKKVKLLQQKLRRRDRTVCNLKDLLKSLRDRGLLESEAEISIIENFGSVAQEIFKNEIKNCKRSANGRRYSETLKQFALTLHYHSPKAYEFCRTLLTLPNPSAISNWTSSVDAEPGFFKEVFEAIKSFPPEDKNCCLILDGMAIRKQIVWHPKSGQFLGYCDFGKNLQLESAETPATEALVFMLVHVAGKWKWPIGYFLITKISAVTQTELIKNALILCSEIRVRVWAVTTDCTATNFATFNNLGCTTSGNFQNINGKFNNPASDNVIHFTPDACHLVKLARNALGSLGQIKTQQGVVDWNILVKLHTLQNNIGLKLGNKLSKSHIEWQKSKMKVKYAAQAFSSSTADALEFLKSAGLEEFKDCDETIKFIRTIDKIFDFLNSRNPFAKGYKAPIRPENIDTLESIVLPLVQYLFSLKDIHDNFLHCGPKKTFIIGFALCVKSVISVARVLFPAVPSMKYFLAYKISQDHLELLFSKIRKRFGSNNNPNALQFKTAMKQIMLKNSIDASPSANCIALDIDRSGCIFDLRWSYQRYQQSFGYVMDSSQDEIKKDNEKMLDFGISTLNSQTTLAKDNILYYISGYVVKLVVKKISCSACVEAVSENLESAKFLQFKHLFNLKNRGGLMPASNDVFKIVKECEKNLLVHTNDFTNVQKKNLVGKIIYNMKEFALDSPVFKHLICDNGFGENVHKIELIVLISLKYISIRLHAHAKHLQSLTTASCRQKLTKLILFRNE